MFVDQKVKTRVITTLLLPLNTSQCYGASAVSAEGTTGLYYFPCNMTMNGSRNLNALEEKLKLHISMH